MAEDSLKTRLQDDVKTAMRAKDKERLSVLRMFTAAIKQIEIDERVELDEARVLAVLDKMIKQRKDAAQQFKDADRTDLFDKEMAEIKILETYLPQALSQEEILELVQAAIAESGATSPREMGKVMTLLKPRLQGRADMGQVSGQVKGLLNN